MAVVISIDAGTTGVRSFAVDETGTLVGYLVLSRYVDAWHVMNVAVRAEQRRQGIASLLLNRLFELTAGRSRRGYTLEVRVSNTGAIALYEGLGYELVRTWTTYRKPL